MFENRVLRRIFGPTLVELTKYSRRQYKEDHNTFYVHALFTQVIRSRRMRWLGHWHEWEGGCMKGTYRVLVGKPEAHRPPGGHGRRWKDNIRTDIQEVRRMLWSKLI